MTTYFSVLPYFLTSLHFLPHPVFANSPLFSLESFLDTQREYPVNSEQPRHLHEETNPHPKIHIQGLQSLQSDQSMRG
jgi:hypothetical protein